MGDSLLGRISRRLRESADRRNLARYTRGEFQSFTVDAAPRRPEAPSGDSAGPMRAKRAPFQGFSNRIWRSHSPGDTYAPRTVPAPPPSPPVPAPPPKPAPIAKAVPAVAPKPAPAPAPAVAAPRPDPAAIVASKFLAADERATPRRGTFTADDRPPLRSPGPATEEPRWGGLPRRIAPGQLSHAGSFYEVADEPAPLSTPEPEPAGALENVASAPEVQPEAPVDEPDSVGIPEASDNERGGGSHLDKTVDGWMGREFEPGSWMDRTGVSGLSPGDIDATGAAGEGIGPDEIASLRQMAARREAIRAEKSRLGGEQRGLVQAADRARASDPTGRDADMIRRVAEARRAAKRTGSTGPMFSANDLAEFADEPSALDPISRVEEETKTGGPFRVLPEDRSSFDHARAARKLRERIARLGPSGLLQDSAQGPGGTE